VLFDSANNMIIGDKTFASLDSGWASISGENAARIGSIHELSSDVLWITNLTEEQFYRASLISHPNFRSEGYLRSTLRHIYSELGVDPQHVSADVVAKVLATVAQRSVDTARNQYGVKRLQRKALNDEFAIVLAAPRSQIAHEVYEMFEGSAQHSYVRAVMQNTYMNNGQTLTLRRNRLMHARELMFAPVPPDGQWEYISKARLPAAKSDIEKMLEQSKTAFIVHCEVKNVSPIVADIFSVGSGSRSIRNWLTDTEWKIAREWADIEYNGLLLCGAESAPLAQSAALPKGEYAALSFTCCLTAEQIWTAMTMKRGPKDDCRYTAAAAWLRARDRMAMFSYAQKLHAKGLNVWGYGGGNVVVLYPEGGLRNALDVSTDIGLLAPASKLLEARRDMPGGITNGIV